MSGNNHRTVDTLLNGRHVFIKYPGKLREKIRKLVEAGPSRLQVISDFDKTITKYKHLSKKIPSSHHIIETHSSVPGDIQEKFLKLQDKYYAIEIDHRLAIPEKIPHMLDWWNSASDLLVQAKIQKSQVPEMVEEAHVHLRDGFTHLSQRLRDSEIPLLVFSAGVGDILEEVLHKQCGLTPNMKIVANYMEFDSDDLLTGFKGQTIHTFNKNEAALKGDEQWEERARGRHNVILMGDMMGDLTMADGVPDLDICIKIGFLNSNFDKLLDQYMDSWDIVLEDDQTMDLPNAILDVMLS